MRYHPSHRNIVWTVLFSILAVLSLNGCGDTSKVSAPPPGPAALTITSGSPLPSGTINIPYSTTLAADGGKPGYTWSLATGSQALPDGLNLSPAGVISGTPTRIQTVSPIFVVQDSTTPTPTVVQKTLAISINAVPQPTITTPSPLPNGIVNQVYSSTTLTAVGGTPPYTWSATVTPALPSGLTFNAGTATISGTPTATETNVPHTFSVTDSFSPTPQTVSKGLALTVSLLPMPLTITTSSPLPGGTVTKPYGPVQLLATGGTPCGTPPYTWSIVGGSTPAPGLFLSSDGNITGTPSTAQVAPFTKTYQVQDCAVPPKTTTTPLSITVGLPTAPKIATTSLPNGSFKVFYSQTLQLQAGTGTAPFIWSFNGQLPTGLGLDSSTGVISGTPSFDGKFDFTPQVIDKTFQTDPAPPALSITIDPQAPPSITPFTLPNGTVNQGYPTIQLLATGGITPYINWSVTPALPNGLQFNILGPGIISGTPLTPSPLTNYSFTVTDSTLPIGQTSLPLVRSLTINAAVTINNSSPLPSGTVGHTYTAGAPLTTLTASGGTGGYKNWLVTPSLPTGLTLDNSTGAITGMPTTASPATNYTFSVQDSSNNTGTKQLSLAVNAAVTINNSSPLPSGTVGHTYTAGAPLTTLTASGGTGGYKNWLVTPSLPTGLTLDNSTGAITGMPTTASPATNYTFSVQDSSNNTGSKLLSLTIN